MTWYASGWKNVPPMSTCESVTSNPKRIIGPRSTQTFTLKLSECKDDYEPSREVNYIEQVQAFVTLSTDRRGEIEIYLHSPSNTRSQILPVCSTRFLVVKTKIHCRSLCRDENAIKAIKVSKIGLFSLCNYGVKFLTDNGNWKSPISEAVQVNNH